MMYSGFWAHGSTSGLFKSKLHNYNEVLDPNNPYELYNKALRMIRDVDNNTSNETVKIVDKWIKLCNKRLHQSDHLELELDILRKWRNVLDSIDSVVY